MTEARRYVPPGAGELTPYICPREAAKAIDWYVELFGAVETMQRFLEPGGKIGHAELSIGDAQIMLSDAHPDYGAVAPEPGNTTATFALNLYVPDADATMAAAEQTGATVQRPVEEQFYGSRMGTMIDPFGVHWMIGTHVRDISAEELAKAAEDYTGAEPGPVQ